MIFLKDKILKCYKIKLMQDIYELNYYNKIVVNNIE